MHTFPQRRGLLAEVFWERPSVDSPLFAVNFIPRSGCVPSAAVRKNQQPGSPAPVRDTLTFVTWLAYVYVEVRGMTSQKKSDLPQGTLDLLVLQIVALGPLHGYAIAQRLKQMSRDVVQVTQGTLYPALHRLENRGLLTADWKVSDTGREAKFYRLTRKGSAHLQAEAASWERLTGAIATILKAAKGEAS